MACCTRLRAGLREILFAGTQDLRVTSHHALAALIQVRKGGMAHLEDAVKICQVWMNFVILDGLDVIVNSVVLKQVLVMRDVHPQLTPILDSWPQLIAPTARSLGAHGPARLAVNTVWRRLTVVIRVQVRQRLALLPRGPQVGIHVIPAANRTFAQVKECHVRSPHAFEAHSIEGGAVDSMGMLEKSSSTRQPQTCAGAQHESEEDASLGHLAASLVLGFCGSKERGILLRVLENLDRPDRRQHGTTRHQD